MKFAPTSLVLEKLLFWVCLTVSDPFPLNKGIVAVAELLFYGPPTHFVAKGNCKMYFALFYYQKCTAYEPENETTNKMTCAPTEDSVQPESESSLSADTHKA